MQPTCVMGMVPGFVQAGLFGRKFWVLKVGESRWLRTIAVRLRLRGHARTTARSRWVRWGKCYAHASQWLDPIRGVAPPTSSGQKKVRGREWVDGRAVGGRILKNPEGRCPYIPGATPCFDLRERQPTPAQTIHSLIEVLVVDPQDNVDRI